MPDDPRITLAEDRRDGLWTDDDHLALLADYERWLYGEVEDTW